MGSPFKSIYQISPLQSIYPTSQPIFTRMKPILVLLLSVLSLSHGDPIDDTMDDPMGDPEDNLGDDLPDVEELEMQAFEKCESDGEEGLTWDEVEACEAIFRPMLTDQGIVLPTEEDFQASDLNKDGILLLKEWKDMDMDMVDDEYVIVI